MTVNPLMIRTRTKILADVSSSLTSLNPTVLTVMTVM